MFAHESRADLSYVAAAVPQKPVLHPYDAVPTRAEYTAAVRELKSGKASGEDGVLAELLKAAGRDPNELRVGYVSST